MTTDDRTCGVEGCDAVAEHWSLEAKRNPERVSLWYRCDEHVGVPQDESRAYGSELNPTNQQEV